MDGLFSELHEGLIKGLNHMTTMHLCVYNAYFSSDHWSRTRTGIVDSYMCDRFRITCVFHFHTGVKDPINFIFGPLGDSSDVIIVRNIRTYHEWQWVPRQVCDKQLLKITLRIKKDCLFWDKMLWKISSLLWKISSLLWDFSRKATV